MDQHAPYGFDPARARVLPNGFDADLFRPDPGARATLRAELGLAEDALLVGMLARRHPFKGHEIFLRAMAAVRRRQPLAHAVCAGRGVADDQALAVLAGETDLKGHAHLIGARRDAPRFLAGLDVLCVASRWGEGFPNVLGEALACGTPCVATDVGESRTILEGVGRVVPPEDADALAAALGGALDLDAAERADLGHLGRQRVLDRYSLAAVAQMYEELYAEVAGSA